MLDALNKPMKPPRIVGGWWQASQAKRDIARLVVEKAKAQWDFTYIRANFDGIVTRRNVDPGEYISASEQGPRRPLLTVLRNDPVRVVVKADEAETPFLRRGLPVKLASNTVPALAVLDCKVSRVGFAINEDTGTMPVEIDVPNPKNLLRPGMFIWATIQLDQKAPANAVTVPTSTIVKRKGQAYVYVVHEGEVRLTPIQMTLTDGDKTEIASGVGASDRLVVDPSHLQGEVVPIKIRKAP
jgi:membrane fusion protein (multidrug efflux system)